MAPKNQPMTAQEEARRASHSPFKYIFRPATRCIHIT
jgi:hypothetical protein